MTWNRMLLCGPAACLILALTGPFIYPHELDQRSRPSLIYGPNGEKSTYEKVHAGLRTFACQVVEPTDLATTLTLEELRAGQMKWREVIQSLRVKFDQRFHRYFETPEDLQDKQNGGLGAGDLHYEIEFAIKGGHLFLQERGITKADLHNPNTVLPPYTVKTFGPKNSAKLNKYAMAAHVLPREVPDPGTANYYFEFIAWPFGTKDYSDDSYYIPKALTLPSYGLLPRLEKVDGFLCHVVTDGRDTFWVDPAHGFCVRRRVIFRPADNAPGYCVRSVRLCQDIIEVVPGVWLPRKGRRMLFPTTPLSLVGKVHSVTEVDVQSIKVNQVLDTAFEPLLPPGTRVIDHVKEITYIVPRGEQLMADAVANAAPIVGGEIPDAEAYRLQTTAFRMRGYLEISIVVLSLTLLGLLVLQWRKAKKAGAVTK